MKITQLYMRFVDKHKHYIRRILKCIVIFVLFGFLISILLWTLTKVKRLSDILHDDHKGVWTPMSTSNFSKWYSEPESCLLQQELFKHLSPNNNYNNNNNKKCGDIQNPYLHLKLKCSLGSSVGNRKCLTPFLSKKYYAYQPTHHYLNDHTNTKLRHILSYISSKKKPLVFIGDVISKQNMDAFLCETLRSDKSIYITLNNNITTTMNTLIYTLYTNYSYIGYTIHWKNKPNNYIHVMFLHLTHIILKNNAKYDDVDSNENKNYIKQNSDGYDNIQITIDSTNIHNITLNSTNTTTTSSNYTANTIVRRLQTDINKKSDNKNGQSKPKKPVPKPKKSG